MVSKLSREKYAIFHKSLAHMTGRGLARKKEILGHPFPLLNPNEMIADALTHWGAIINKREADRKRCEQFTVKIPIDPPFMS